jgi:hypothetical protein
MQCRSDFLAFPSPTRPTPRIASYPTSLSGLARKVPANSCGHPTNFSGVTYLGCAFPRSLQLIRAHRRGEGPSTPPRRSWWAPAAKNLYGIVSARMVLGHRLQHGAVSPSSPTSTSTPTASPRCIAEFATRLEAPCFLEGTDVKRVFTTCTGRRKVLGLSHPCSATRGG